jgi:hypothetical protein
MKLFKLQRHWSDQLLHPIGIGGYLITLWVLVTKDT